MIEITKETFPDNGSVYFWLNYAALQSSMPSDVFSLDIKQNADVAIAKNITFFPTVVVYSGGVETERHVGLLAIKRHFNI